MDIASVFLKSADLLLKITTSPIAKEIESIWKYESDIKRLGDTVAMIGDVLSDVEDQQFQEKSVRRAYKRLRGAYLDAEDFLDEVESHRKKLEAVTSKFNKEKGEMMNNAIGKRKKLLTHFRIKKKTISRKIHRFLSGPNRVKHAVKMHNAIKKIRKNLDEIQEDVNKFNLNTKVPIITPATTDHMNYRATGPCVDTDNIIGREEDKRKIIDLLLRSSTNPKKIPVLSIVGIGGMGKTTIAQLLYKDRSWQQSCRFDLKIWVPDCKKFDVKSMLKNILKSISRPDDTNVDSLDDNHLKQRFVDKIGGKSFFLVLDDVENEDPIIWKQLESLLNQGNRRESRILVTTRSRKVADVMGLDSLYELHGLSETDALQLFESYAFPRGRVEDLVEIGKLCVEKCLGVPLAVQVIGSLLRDEKDKNQWERVRKDIDSAIKDESNQIIPILMISYYNLDSALKQCFSYCALFPKNYHISKKILSSIWRVNVQLENKGGFLEDDCEKNLKTLCDRCLLEEEGHGNSVFKMHDLMHDLATNVAGEEMLFEVNSNKLILEENVRHFSLMRGKIEDGKFATFQIKGKRLRTFLQLDHPSNITPRMTFSVDELVLGCPVLRLLDMHSQGIESLTNSIGKLIHLRYLDLSHNNFQTLPISIVELINLRHLSLANCVALTHLPFGMDALTSLEVLDISGCKQLEELPMGALSSLKVLDISGCVKSKEQLMGIENLINLRILNLKDCMDLTRLPSGMGALTSLQVLDISGCKQLEELPMGALSSLKVLDISRCFKSGEQLMGIENLINLEVLNISDCSELKELGLGVLMLINLKRLNLARCRSLTQMPSEIGGLTSLEVLDLSYCEKLEELPESILKLTKLEHLNLFDCKSLKEIPMGIVKLTKLKDLRFEGRKALTHLPYGISAEFESITTTLKIELLNNITLTEYLEVEDFLVNCKRLKGLEMEWKDNPKEEEASNHNVILEKLHSPPNLEVEEFPPQFLNFSSFTFVLPNLTDIRIWNCRKCQVLPPLSGLAGLTNLVLCGLGNLEYIEENVSAASFCPSLKRLKLADLPELKGWCRGAATTGAEEQLPSFPCLYILEILSCPSLTVAPILLSFVKLFSELSSSCVNLFVQVCESNGGFRLRCLTIDYGGSKSDWVLDLEISDWDASGSQSINIMPKSFEEMSNYLWMLKIKNCPGLLTGSWNWTDHQFPRQASGGAVSELVGIRIPEAIQFLPVLERLAL